MLACRQRRGNRVVKFARFLLALLAVSAGPVQAQWYEASSDHFVIYAEDQEKDVRVFAENLEKYHAAISMVSGRSIEPPSPSNRLTIFVVGSQRDIRKLARTKDQALAGFYLPRAGASRAFVQDIRNRSNGYPDFSTVILLHEYAHHFLMSSSRHALPRWMNEGGAEFLASTIFNKDGSIQIGRPAKHRAGELTYASEVSVHELLDPELYENRRRQGYDAFYGMSWALYHYLVFNPDRKGQLGEYAALVTKGLASMAAAEKAFGDIDTLQEEVERYLKQRRMQTYNIAAEAISYNPIRLRELPDGEAEMMDVRIVSQRGVSRDEAIELLPDARKTAERYPDDPGVLTALAEAEYDAGNDDAAIAAADRATAIDPQRRNAYVQKGYALFRKAENADNPEAAYGEAMKAFGALNQIENDHPLPLIHYYLSFVRRGAQLTENARHALERAAQLSPFDQGLAMMAALMFADEGKIMMARASLEPVANNPHGGSLADNARAILLSLEGVEEGSHWQPETIPDPVVSTEQPTL
ncbi:hypothetical protein [Qipengyuania spongiae]|uniref:hypothetical protein n=1 Tax=Qipengyuania spongiae TaxID=2909673 RepID=UPI003B96C419